MRPSSFLVHRACADLGGVARAAELRAAGLGRRDLTRAVDDASIIRLRQGIYGVAELPADVAAAIRPGGALGCLSVAAEHGVWLLDPPTRVHVAMRPIRTPDATGATRADASRTGIARAQPSAG